MRGPAFLCLVLTPYLCSALDQMVRLPASPFYNREVTNGRSHKPDFKFITIRLYVLFCQYCRFSAEYYAPRL